MMNKFTNSANSAIEYANEIAIELGHNYVGTEHLLYGLAKEENSIASQVLANQNIYADDILSKIEELVGNIFDEYDEVENEYEKIDENTYRLSGSISICDLKKILNVEIPDGDYDTLSGYLVELLDRIPNDDEKPIIETEQVTYKIEEYEDKRILWVKACRNNTQNKHTED